MCYFSNSLSISTLVYDLRKRTNIVGWFSNKPCKFKATVIHGLKHF